MRDRGMRRWRALVRERANREWRELSLDVVDELACHLADLHASALRDGASDAEADRRALEALSAASFLELSKRPRARRAGGYAHDFRVSIRHLIATPMVTTIAVVSLALGIGANTAIFSLVNSLVLRALPVKEPQRLAVLTDTGTPRGNDTWTFPVWQELRARALFENAFAWATRRFNLADGGVTEFVDGIWTSWEIFDTLGVTPSIGRGFTEADDRPGGGPDGPVAVISYAFWQRRFGGDADAIGRRLTVERVPFTVVGVMPSDFFGPDVGRRVDVAIPIGTEPLIRGAESSLDKRDSWWLDVMARLKTDQSLVSATAAVQAIQPQIRAATLPTDWTQSDLDTHFLKDKFVLTAAATGNSRLRNQYQRPLWTIMIVVVLVLLIACANIANLLLARATARRHEWSVRIALGASRWRLVRLLLTESFILSIVGAGLGVLVARWGSALLVSQLSTQTSTVFLDLGLDWRVLAFTTGVTVLTTLLFGIAPAVRAAGAAPMEAIQAQGRGPDSSSARLSIASALVVVQVALSVTLVVAAALFTRTFVNLANLRVGFEPGGVLIVSMNALRAPIEPSQRLATYERALHAVEALPGVRSATLSFVTPLSGYNWGTRFEVSGGVPLPEGQRSSLRNQVSPAFFETYGQRVVAGRNFTQRDRAGAPFVAVVNEAFSRKYLNGASPIGHTIHSAGITPGPPLEIVGVVEDAVYRRLRDPAPSTVYTPVGQNDEDDLPIEQFELSVRAERGSPARLTRSIADAIASVNRDLAVTFRPLADQVNAAFAQERIVAMLASFFGGLALLLAGLGLYGVTSYVVSRRRTEIGIRMALGAAPDSVIRLVLGRVAVLVGVGVIVGTVVSLWASQYVSSLLFGLQPRDPATLLGSAAILAAVGTIAAWLPAYRASRIDPAIVLRDS
jgi:putative ABC transport system permease protein